MDEIEQKNLIIALNEANMTYCQIYEEFFNQKFGQYVDYNRYIETVETVISDFSTYKESSQSLFSNVDYRIIANYLDNRISSASQLLKMTKNLEMKGNRVKRYSFFAYRKDLKALLLTESQVTEVGASLQQIADKILND